MPIYLYRCQSCHVEFERIEMYSDKPLALCPECQQSTVHRIPQLSAVVFKGSGWYSNDHPTLSSQKIRVLNQQNEKTGKTLIKENTS